MPGRYGSMIGSEGNCWESAVKTEELDGPLREGYYAWKLMGSSHTLVSRKLWGYHGDSIFHIEI